MDHRRAPKPKTVTVVAPARLHLGFLDLNGGTGRLFGSIGVSIEGLRTKVALAPAAQMHITGHDRERAARYLTTMIDRLGIAGRFHLDVEEAVPAHSGLGSGTQLALAIAAALRHLEGLAPDPAGDAEALGRGRRSGVGIGLFERGGLIVEGGRGPDTGVAPVVSRLPFPENWCVLVLLDSGCGGLHGEAEVSAFAQLPPFREREAAEICRLVLMGALPAVAERDIERFGYAIREIQARLGDYFAPAQGGSRFTSPAVAAMLDLLEREGAVGIGQSSWGPTGYAFARDEHEARRLAGIARADAGGAGLDIRICRGRNEGARISVQAAEAEVVK